MNKKGQRLRANQLGRGGEVWVRGCLRPLLSAGSEPPQCTSGPFCATFALGVNAEEAETGSTSDSTKQLRPDWRVPHQAPQQGPGKTKGHGPCQRPCRAEVVWPKASVTKHRPPVLGAWRTHCEAPGLGSRQSGRRLGVLVLMSWAQSRGCGATRTQWAHPTSQLRDYGWATSLSGLSSLF